jgi:hypothetical protein
VDRASQQRIVAALRRQFSVAPLAFFLPRRRAAASLARA